MDSLEILVEKSEIPFGIIKFLLCLFSLLPLSLFYKIVPVGRSRELYSIISGTYLTFIGYGFAGLENLIISPLVTYLLLLILPRSSCALWISGFCFAHLIVCHVVNASGASWSEGNIDFTGSQMVLVLKCVAVAFNYQDGTISKSEMTSHQTATHLTSLPSLPAFLAYMTDPTTVLIGPFLEYKHYNNFIHNKGVYDPLAKSLRPASSWLPSFLTTFFFTLLYLALHTYLMRAFPYSLITTPEWLQAPMWRKLALAFIVVIGQRFKYYFSWNLTYAGLKLSGQAWAGPQEGWVRGLNVRPMKVELATSSADYPIHWNICTGNWLRHYVYTRQQGPKQSPGFRALIVTQTVSGVWHGLYPGYWLFFLSSALMLQGSRWMYKMTAGAPVTVQPVLTFIHGVLSAIQLNYLALSFLLLDFGSTVQTWRELYFIGHAVMALVLVLSMILKPPKKSKVL